MYSNALVLLGSSKCMDNVAVHLRYRKQQIVLVRCAGSLGNKWSVDVTLF